MKQLSDKDIDNMCMSAFIPDNNVVKRIRSDLHLSSMIPKETETKNQFYRKLDLHHYTEEQAWEAINNLIHSNVKSATIITGASGILKIKFQQWSSESKISEYFLSVKPINNGSFAVKFKKQKN